MANPATVIVQSPLLRERVRGALVELAWTLSTPLAQQAKTDPERFVEPHMWGMAGNPTIRAAVTTAEDALADLHPDLARIPQALDVMVNAGVSAGDIAYVVLTTWDSLDPDYSMGA